MGVPHQSDGQAGDAHGRATRHRQGAAVLASEDFVKKHNLQKQAVEIVGQAMTSDFESTLTERSCIKLIGARKGVEVAGVQTAPARSESTTSRITFLAGAIALSPMAWSVV